MLALSCFGIYVVLQKRQKSSILRRASDRPICRRLRLPERARRCFGWLAGLQSATFQFRSLFTSSTYLLAERRIRRRKSSEKCENMILPRSHKQIEKPATNRVLDDRRVRLCLQTGEYMVQDHFHHRVCVKLSQ